jgi:hypothetical protein
MRAGFAARRSKYGAVRTEVDGITFASAREAKRYGELKLLERADEIRGLVLQPRFKIMVNGLLICTYVADFAYFERGHWTQTVEDVKGVQTPAFKLKRKLMKAVHHIDVVLI